MIVSYKQCSQLSQEVNQLWKNKNSKIISIESCTGGLISHFLTLWEGSSQYFDRGFIVYSSQSKHSLGVSQEDILQYGTISPEMTHTLVKTVQKKFHLDNSYLIIAITGRCDQTQGSGIAYYELDYQNQNFKQQITLEGSRSNMLLTCSYKILSDILHKFKK